MSTRANIAIKLKEEDKYIALNYLDKRFDDVRPSVRMMSWVNNMPVEKVYVDIYCNSTEDTSFDYLQIYNGSIYNENAGCRTFPPWAN